MNRVDMRIQPSGGLVAMVILHAAILSGVAVVIFSAVTAPGPTEECFLPEIEPQDEPTIGRAIELPPVDVAAQQELKQQLFRWRRTTTGRQPCVPCQGSTSRRPSAPADRVVKPLPVDPAEPNEPDTPDALVDPSDADSATKSPLPRSTWQLALFLDDSPLSRRVGKWFESDASLRRLRQQCEFQQYSADNPLYRTRYAERIPVDAFPVVLLQDARGGHIHVASRHNLPEA